MVPEAPKFLVGRQPMTTSHVAGLTKAMIDRNFGIQSFAHDKENAGSVMNASRCGLPPRPNSIVQKYRERAAASKKDKGCSFDIMMGHGPRQSRPFLSETFDRAKLAKCKAYKSMQHRT